MTEGVAQVVEFLFSKNEALTSNYSTAEKKYNILIEGRKNVKKKFKM
jgi:hypothetical protein